MDELVREGKVRYAGASNYASWQVCRMLWLAERNGWPPVRVVQPMYNLLARGVEPEFLPMCREFGLATVAYNPLAGGLLTGKHRAGGPARGRDSTGCRRTGTGTGPRPTSRPSGSCRASPRPRGDRSVSLALGWLLHHTAVDCVIVGASSLEQLGENLAAADDGPLAPEPVAACDRAWQAVRGVSPAYNR